MSAGAKFGQPHQQPLPYSGTFVAASSSFLGYIGSRGWTMFDVDCANRRSPKSVPRTLLLVVRLGGLRQARITLVRYGSMKFDPQLWTAFIRSCNQFPERAAIDIRRWRASLPSRPFSLLERCGEARAFLGFTSDHRQILHRILRRIRTRLVSINR